ncbi:MAG: GNAT family N-acetyltransferase [Pseudomonadota bacterium]
MIVAFRQALATDADIVRQLARASAASITDAQTQTTVEIERQFFSNEFDPENSALLHVGGNAVGFVRLFVSNVHIVVNQLAIAPAFQSNGFGGDALAQLQERWQGAGLTASTTVPKSRRARVFFERAGFAYAGGGAAYDTLIWSNADQLGGNSNPSDGRD